jgi:cytochrome c oxidase cbb3-type subunit 4
MSPVIFHSFWTVLLLILFIGIVLWVFSSRRKKQFDAAARLPLEDDDASSVDSAGEKKHG